MDYTEIKELIHCVKSDEDLFNARSELARYRATGEDQRAYKILLGEWNNKSVQLVNKKAQE